MPEQSFDNDDPSTEPGQPGNPGEPGEEDGPGHVIITIPLTPDTPTVTGPTTVSWGATPPDGSGSDPDLSLSFYEAVPSSVSGLTEFRDIVVSPMPTISWSNGVGTFEVNMNSDIFDQLVSRQTSFAVKVQIVGVDSHGMSKIDIDLPEA